MANAINNLFYQKRNTFNTKVIHFLHNLTIELIKYSMKKNIPIFLLFLFTFLIFYQNKEVQVAIIDSCELFITKLFPSLFPMMILCDLFIYFDLPEFFCKYFGSFFSKVFHTSPNGAFAFFISCFSGTPSNAYMIKNLYLENVLTKEEASHILSFSFFTNPLFYPLSCKYFNRFFVSS